MTRSKQKRANDVDITTYQTFNKSSDKGMTVVSKRGLKSDPKHYQELEKRFERIEAKRKLKEEMAKESDADLEALPVSPEIWERRNTIFFVTHFNVFLYATCFFIQVGTLPVSVNFCTQSN